MTNSYTYTGREDDGTSLMYYRARYYDPELEIFISQYPKGNAQRYANGSPIKYIDPLGLDGIYVVYPGYPITVPGTNAKLPLGHAAVIAVDPKTGLTKYFEYGRYGDDFGSVQSRLVPDVVIGSDGKPTEESLKNLYKEIAKKYGHGIAPQTTYYSDADFQKIVDFAKRRMSDPNRAPYSWYPWNSNTCYDFAKEAINAGRK